MTFIVPNVPFFQKEEGSLSRSVKLVVLITKSDCAMFTATNLFKGRNNVEKKIRLLRRFSFYGIGVHHT